MSQFHNNLVVVPDYLWNSPPIILKVKRCKVAKKPVKKRYLKKIKDKYYFYIDGENHIRAKVSKRAEFEFCPLTLIAYNLTGKRFSIGEFNEVGKSIAIFGDTIADVIRTADRHTPWGECHNKMRKILGWPVEAKS